MCSSPRTSTRTPVVLRMSRAQARAQRWPTSPEASISEERREMVPRTIVYRAIAGIRKRTVRHQWYGGTSGARAVRAADHFAPCARPADIGGAAGAVGGG